jgi:hypothetical protein
MLPSGIGAEARTIVASENLSAGQLVNIFDDSGTVKVRKADASNGRVAHGFVLQSVTSGGNATVYMEGTISGLSGLTVGTYYFLSATTPGSVSATPPSTAGQYAQIIGYAVSTTEITFKPQAPIILG